MDCFDKGKIEKGTLVDFSHRGGYTNFCGLTFAQNVADILKTKLRDS